MLRYPCLVLDHDDTCVDSSGTIGYPHFCRVLSHFRPDLTITETEFRAHCLNPGFQHLYAEVLCFTEEELALERRMWSEYVHAHYPRFFQGIPEILRRQWEEGGIVCIVSHSNSDIIAATYRHAGIQMPDLIFGSELPPEQRKPNPWPLNEIMRHFHLKPQDMLVVDDLPPGCVMAHSCGVEFAAAAWCGVLPETQTTMQQIGDYMFHTVDDFSQFLFERK